MDDDKQDSLSATVEETAPPSETADDAPVNPRKRKKSSRACDFCHINHQPCDNAKPKCSYCERHGKSCLYLRPQKKRGPAQGYRSALHTMRESAAAWGAALNLIPSLGPVIEGYLKQSEEGRRLSKAIKDPQQQEFFIQAWQQSSVFKAFFGDDASPDSATEGDSSSLPPVPQPGSESGPVIPPPAPASAAGASSSHESPVGKLDSGAMVVQSHVPTPSPSQDGCKMVSYKMNIPDGGGPASLSLSDIVAKDAARSSHSFSQTLGSLGFAPDETLDDFLALASDPDPIENPRGAGNVDPSLGSEMDQKAYYELLMGKQFT